jgi:hypothetical protein
MLRIEPDPLDKAERAAAVDARSRAILIVQRRKLDRAVDIGADGHRRGRVIAVEQDLYPPFASGLARGEIDRDANDGIDGMRAQQATARPMSGAATGAR